MHVLRDPMEAKSISRVDAAAVQEAVDREPFQKTRQAPTSATKSATRDHSHRSKKHRATAETPEAWYTSV